MKSSNLRYEPRIDHLRFVAATLVFLFHVYHFYYLKWTPQPDKAWLGLITEGHTGVSLFFALSGFIFMQIALHSEEINYRRFMINRVLRIAPLFLFVFFIAISIGRDEFKGYYVFYTLFSNLGEAPTSGSFVTGAAWTIGIEFTFYLIFPFLARFFKLYGVAWMMKLFIILAVVKVACYLVSERSTHLFYSTLVGRFDQFLLGMLFAHVYFHCGARLKKYGGLLFLFALLVVWANAYLQARYFSRYLPDPDQLAWVSWSFQEALGWSLLILSYLLLPVRIPLFLDRLMCQLGEVSYSFYLFHGMVIYVAYHTLGPLELVSFSPLNGLLNAGILFFPVWAVASLSYQSIELPFLEMRKRYTTLQ